MAKRVLVANDERHIVRLAEVNLQRCGYEVLLSYDPESAFDLAKVEQPDLVLLDGTWIDLVVRLKSDPATRTIEIRMVA